MKNCLVLFLLFFSFITHAQISIVSDLDETIKITQYGETSDILGSKVYTGMPEFFHGVKTYSNKLHILSASPIFLEERVEHVLAENNISYNSLTLRTNLFESKFDFKVKEIKKILKRTHDKFIFFGDDVGQDPETYLEIKRLFPDRVLGTYIHVITNRALPQSVVRYWTSFDLVLREFLDGRLASEWVELVAEKLLNVQDLNYVFSKKAECPTSSVIWEWQVATVFQPEAFELSEKFTKFCQQRQSGNIPL